MDKNKCSSCGEAPHKCSCKNKDFTKAVIEIDNPAQITLMRRVVIPMSMGDDTAVPPAIGKYHNVLLYYEANQKSYLYSSDGIPTLLANGLTDYEQAVNLPQINGVTLLGDKSSADLGLQPTLSVSPDTGIKLENNELSGLPATDTTIGMVKPGDGLDIDDTGELSLRDIDNYALFFDTLADMQAATNIIDGSYCHILGRMELNDGGENFYKVRTKTDSDVIDNVKLVAVQDDTLVAELIIKDDYLLFTPIFKRYTIDSDKGVTTDVWYSIIPSDYTPELFLANDQINTVELANRNAYRNKTSLQINAGLCNTTTYVTTGLVINHSELLKENDDMSNDYNIIYMLPDGTLDSVPGDTPTSTVEGLAPEWAVTSWGPIVQNGVEIPHSNTDYKPRTFIGQDTSGNYIVGVATGRKYDQQGLTQPQIKTFVESVGFTPYFLFNLDGGGSSQMISMGRRASRQDYFDSRACANYIGWRRKDASSETVFKSNYNIDTIDDTFEYEREPRLLTSRLSVHEDSEGNVTILGSDSSALQITQQMATVNIRFRTDALTAAYTKLITGLPLPRQSSSLSVIAMNVNDNAVYKLQIQPSTGDDVDGIADLAVGAYGGGLPAGSWFVNVTYPTKDGENRNNF